MYLWDANILKAFADAGADGHANVLAHAQRVGWEHLALPVPVCAEVLEGRLKYLHGAFQRGPTHYPPAFTRLEATLQLVTQFPIVSFDDAALTILQQRSLFLQPIGRTDRLMASIALAGGHVLVTRNVAHFRFISNLRFENWIDDPCP